MMIVTENARPKDGGNCSQVSDTQIYLWITWRADEKKGKKIKRRTNKKWTLTLKQDHQREGGGSVERKWDGIAPGLKPAPLPIIHPNSNLCRNRSCGRFKKQTKTEIIDLNSNLRRYRSCGRSPTSVGSPSWFRCWGWEVVSFCFSSKYSTRRDGNIYSTAKTAKTGAHQTSM